MVSAGEGAISASGAVTETITEKGKRVAKMLEIKGKVSTAICYAKVIETGRYHRCHP